MIQKLIIGAPFGNYLRWDCATPTLGTYTLHRRAGPLRRLWRVLSTVCYSWRTRSWINRLGLPSPGIDALAGQAPLAGAILSIHGFDRNEWLTLAGRVESLQPEAVELNLSCPNVGCAVAGDVFPAVEFLLASGAEVIAKLPPVRWMDWAVPLFGLGVRHFHLCNTIPTPGGGLSGKPLKQFSLWAVSEVRQRWAGAVQIVGGGGVTCLDDVQEYVAAGADRVAVASMLLNPLSWRKIPQFAASLEPQNHSSP